MKTVFFSVSLDLLKFLFSFQHTDLVCISLYLYLNIFCAVLNGTLKKFQFPIVHCYCIVVYACVCVWIDLISCDLLNSFISSSRQLCFIWIEIVLFMTFHSILFSFLFLALLHCLEFLLWWWIGETTDVILAWSLMLGGKHSVYCPGQNRMSWSPYVSQPNSSFSKILFHSFTQQRNTQCLTSC